MKRKKKLYKIKLTYYEKSDINTLLVYQFTKYFYNTSNFRILMTTAILKLN